MDTKIVVVKEPPKFVLAFMLIIFAIMVWIATVQFMHNMDLFRLAPNCVS